MKLTLKKEYTPDGKIVHFIYLDSKIVECKYDLKEAEEIYAKLLEYYKKPLPIPEIIKETEI